jgi:hypothetical protein
MCVMVLLCILYSSFNKAYSSEKSLMQLYKHFDSSMISHSYIRSSYDSCVLHAIWLRGLVGDLGLQRDETVVFCDSQSTINLTKNQMYHERTKHIDVKYHFFREIVTQVISL